MPKVYTTFPSAATVDSFSIIQPDLGTSPVADSPTDTLNITSSDGSIVVTGDATTDTIDLQLSGGLMTEYTEDDPSPTHPTGPQIIARRRDVLQVETSNTGDFTALNSTSKGELYVKHVDSIPVTQSTSPWVVGGTLSVLGGTMTITNTGFTAFQGTLPWIIGGTLSAAGGTFTFSNTGITAMQGTNPWIVGGTISIAGGTFTFSNAGITATQGTNPWIVGGTVSIAGGTLSIAGGTLTIGGALPTGANTIGSIASITTSIVPGTAATNLGKAEDAAHTSGDTGVMPLAVRNDSTAQTSLTTTDGDYSPFAVDIKGNHLAVGNLPHDAVDVGNPVKIGGKTFTATSLPSAVAVSDRTDAFFDINGFQHIKNHAQEDAGTVLTAINTTYNNTTTNANSADITTTNSFRTCDLIFTLVSALTPTDIQFIIQAKDGSTYFDMRNGFLSKFMFDDVAVATAQNVHVTFPVPATGTFRVRVVATGSSAVNTFTVSNAKVFLRT